MCNMSIGHYKQLSSTIVFPLADVPLLIVAHSLIVQLLPMMVNESPLNFKSCE